MDIVYQYTKIRSNFGRQPFFCEQGPVLSDSFGADKIEQKRYCLRNPVNQSVQHGPCYAKHDINTIRAEYSTTSVNHAEGGWPKDVLVTDPEATQRYRRKVEKDDIYVHCVMTTSGGMEHYLKQNNAIDMYHTYYVNMPEVKPPEQCSCRTVNVYRDKPAERPVSSVCWQPDGGRHFAVTYVDVDFNRETRKPVWCNVWDVENANFPVEKVWPSCSLLDLQYNPREPAQLAGGLINGQVAVWDRRRGHPPVLECAPHMAHRDYVKQVAFINAKSGQEFFSVSSDGINKWWDARNMSETIDEMIIDPPLTPYDVPTPSRSLGVSALEFEQTIPTRFMCGTENGYIVCGNRKGKTPSEKLPAKFLAHLGPVYSLERNPGFLKNFLTVGDWTVRVWSEDCRESAILWSPPLRQKITAATWSPQRFAHFVYKLRLSLLVTMQSDGVLGLWDWLRRQQAPILTMQVCSEPLLRVKIQEQGTMVACGSQTGSVYMVELTHSLAEAQPHDKQLLTQVFEREAKRERILESRLREIRLKLKQAEEGVIVGSPGGGSATEMEGTIGDRDLHEATTTYTQAVRRELTLM